MLKLNKKIFDNAMAKIYLSLQTLLKKLAYLMLLFAIL